MELSKKILDSTLRYEPETGLFFNRIFRGGRSKINSLAGTKTPIGYIRINIAGRIHYAQRLARLTSHGRMPMMDIDHINGIKDDNRILNLREVSHAENMQNQFKPTGRNPYLGVSQVRGKWQASITRFGYSVSLGMHDTPELARDAYQFAKAMNADEFRLETRKHRLKNRLTMEVLELLADFPGFESGKEVQQKWLMRRALATA